LPLGGFALFRGEESSDELFVGVVGERSKHGVEGRLFEEKLLDDLARRHGWMAAHANSPRVSR